jgi:tRNA threonylcarbamoyladenosine biosynthesis protein TsaE
MIFVRTTSAQATKALAAALAELARPGDLLLLAGDLGAGKTAFTQGFGAALGVDGPITSPTFTLVNTYEGRLELNHLDVYRLEALSEVLDLGVPEMLDEGGVTVIEWGDAVAPALPADYLEIRFTFPDDVPRDSASRDSASRDSASRDSAPRDSASRDSASRDSAPRDSASRDSAPRDSAEGDPDDVRVLELIPVGPRWSARIRAVATAVSEWIHEPDGDD